MPARNLLLPERVARKTHKFPLYIQERILKALVELKANPILGRKLNGELSSCYKLRIGDYRIVYKFNEEKSIVEIVKIEHRQGVYR